MTCAAGRLSGSSTRSVVTSTSTSSSARGAFCVSEPSRPGFVAEARKSSPSRSRLAAWALAWLLVLDAILRNVLRITAAVMLKCRRHNGCSDARVQACQQPVGARIHPLASVLLTASSVFAAGTSSRPTGALGKGDPAKSSLRTASYFN